MDGNGHGDLPTDVPPLAPAAQVFQQRSNGCSRSWRIRSNITGPNHDDLFACHAPPAHNVLLDSYPLLVNEMLEAGISVGFWSHIHLHGPPRTLIFQSVIAG
jgi:hypothetical protein